MAICVGAIRINSTDPLFLSEKNFVGSQEYGELRTILGYIIQILLWWRKCSCHYDCPLHMHFNSEIIIFHHNVNWFITGRVILSNDTIMTQLIWIYQRVGKGVLPSIEFHADLNVSAGVEGCSSIHIVSCWFKFISGWGRVFFRP